jgi:hypothetical protein
MPGGVQLLLLLLFSCPFSHALSSFKVSLRVYPAGASQSSSLMSLIVSLTCIVTTFQVGIVSSQTGELLDWNEGVLGAVWNLHIRPSARTSALTTHALDVHYLT